LSLRKPALREHQQPMPHLTIELVQQSSNIRTSSLPVVNQDTSAKNIGFGFGARLSGHVYEALFLGADARYTRVDMTDSSLGNTSGDAYNLAPVIGIQMPVSGLRFWYSRVVAGDFNPASGKSGLDLRFSEASGNRIGAGFHIMAVSLNIEYEELKYNKTIIESIGSIGVNSSTGVEYDQRGYLASLSFPISI
jgi:hypothetical protein